MRVMHLPFISANRLPGSRPPNGDVWSDRSQLDIRLDEIDVSVLVCNSTQRELATGADSYSAGANLIKIPSVDVTTTIAASDDAEFVSEVTITVKIPEIDLQFSSLHLYSAFAILILLRQLLDFPRQAQQAPPAKWHVRRASHAYRRFSTAVPGPASAQKRASPSQTHLAIQVWVTINRFDVIWTLPDGPRVFWEIDKIHGRGTLPEGEFGGSIKAFRIMGIKPDSTATKSELVRLIGISILVDNKINKTDDPEVNIRSQDSPQADRKEGKESEKRSNKEISVMIEIVESRIPYKYVVADVFDAANNLVKLGKRLALELIPATGELPPPHKERDPIPTIIVAIDAIHCRIDDDPFEIALARTYTAGFEEQKARLAREQAFHHKLSTINQGHGGEASQSPGHHGAGYDVQSAWQSLQEYNSRNWIRRIKEYTALQSSQNAPHNKGDPPTDTAFGMQGEFRNVRSNSTLSFHSSEAMNASSSSLQSVAPSVRPIPLFRVSIFHLQITLRDPGFGRLEAPKRISQLDGGQSSVTQKYDLLFCSDVELGLSEATVRVRNHPLPLVYVPPSRQNMPTLPVESPSTGSTSSVDARQPDSSLVLKGLLILAEPFPAPESIYKPFVPIASIPSEQMDCINRSEQGFGLFVERTVAPIKIFYDIDVKIQSETPTLATFGAHILPSVQDISRVMDTLTKPNLDPSPALGFWDKIRLLLHGRIGIEFVGPPTREVIVQDAQCAEKRREESTAGGFRFLLSGSRDPFYSKNKSAGSAGYEAVWSGGTKMELGGTGTELVSIVADQFIFGIPKGEPDDVSQEPSVDASVGETDGFAKPSRPVAGPGFEKVVVKFSGGIRLAVGALFENENAGTRCQNRPSRAICPHSQVAMRSPENVQQGSKYDSFKSFRSVAIHAIVTLTCPTSQSAAANPYNSIHITPITVIHFENWISLFASNMTLPVRSGCVFPDSQSVPNKKLGRFLHTVRARANISPLFITYMHSGKQSVVGGADVGLKGRLERFVLDLMCEQTMESESSPCPPIWTVAECQLDVTKLDIRAVSYDVTGSASMHPPVGECESQREINCGVKQDSTIGGEDGEWADADDYTEIGKIDEEDRITRGILSGTPIIKPFIFSPRLVYFMQSKHPLEESDDLHVGEKEDEGSSEIIREGRDTHKVQSDLLQRRLREIDQDIERQAIKLKEMESKITQFSADEEMLKEVCAHTKEHVDRMSTLHYKRNVISHYLQNFRKSGQAGQDLLTQGGIPAIQLNVYDDREPQVATPLLLDSAAAASFAHRYIVHDALILWNENVRNIMFKFFDMQQQHSALRYLMSQTAATFVRSMSERRADGNDNGSSDENGEGDHQFDHLAAEELLSKLISEQDQSFVVQNEIFTTEEDLLAESLGQSMSTRDRPKKTKDPRHPEYIPEGYIAQNDHLVQLINPQLNFHSIGNEQGCMIIAAERAQWKSMSILDQNYRKKKNNELVKSRNIFTVDNAQFFLAFKSHFMDPPPGRHEFNYGAKNGEEEWPVWIPMECLVDHGDALGPFQRVVDRSTFTVHYDKHNPVRLVRKKTNRASFTSSHRDTIDEKADSLYIRFPRIKFCANSLQYAMIFDVVTDLLVYNDPLRRERAKHVKALALAADLDNLRGAAEGIIMLQEQIRDLCEEQKRYRDNYTQLKRSEHANQMLTQYEMVNKELLDAKEQLYVMMEAFSAVKENKEGAQLAVRTQIQADQVSWEMLLDSRGPFAEWELKNATFVLLNNEDHSNMKWLEVDQLRLMNRLPHPYFSELVGPFISDPQKSGLLDFSRHKMLRVYWGEMAPVGGIAVVDHFEVNIFPLVFQMTYDIGKHLITYYFPENRKKESTGSGHTRDGSSNSAGTGQTVESPILEGASDSGGNARNGGNSGSNSRLSMNTLEDDSFVMLTRSSTELSDATSSGSVLAASAMAMSAAARAGVVPPANATSIQKQPRGYSIRLTTSSTDLVQMATRASNNKTFIYIKVPGAPHCVSYQGEKETNFVDLSGFLFKSPTLEYRNKTWTWLEFMMQLKKDIIRAVLGHTGSLVNQKLQQLRTRSANVSTTNSIQIPNGPAIPTSPSPLSAPVLTVPSKHVSAESSRASSASSSPIARRKHGRVFSGSALPSSTRDMGSDDQLSTVSNSGLNFVQSDLGGGGKRKDKRKFFGGIKSKMKEIIGHTEQSPPGSISAGDAECGITDNNTESTESVDEAAVKGTSESASKGRLLFGKLYDGAGS